MSKGAIYFSENDDYYTPRWVIDLFGPFDYDPATTLEQAAKHNIPRCDTIDTNGLLTDWTKYKRIWVNPPFTMKKEFLKKAWETYDKVHNDIYFLLPISFLTTQSFHKLCRGGLIYLPTGRINFCNAVGEAKSPAFGSIIMKIDDMWSLLIIDKEKGIC